MVMYQEPRVKRKKHRSTKSKLDLRPVAIFPLAHDYPPIVERERYLSWFTDLSSDPAFPSNPFEFFLRWRLRCNNTHLNFLSSAPFLPVPVIVCVFIVVRSIEWALRRPEMLFCGMLSRTSHWHRWAFYVLQKCFVLILRSIVRRRLFDTLQPWRNFQINVGEQESWERRMKTQGKGEPNALIIITTS